jgi:hypothetical protein
MWGCVYLWEGFVSASCLLSVYGLVCCINVCACMRQYFECVFGSCLWERFEIDWCICMSVGTLWDRLMHLYVCGNALRWTRTFVCVGTHWVGLMYLCVDWIFLEGFWHPYIHGVTFQGMVVSIMKQISSNNSSLLLKIQKTQTIQLCAMLIKMERIYKMSSWKAWVQNPSGLIK